MLFLISIGMTLTVAHAENKDPAMQEFYAGSEILVKEDKPLQQILVPYHVYEVVKSSNLNDLRVFNAAGGLVPHRIATQKKNAQTSTKVLSFAKLTSNSSGLQSLIEKYKSSGVDISLNLRAMDTDSSSVNQDVYIGEVGKLEGTATELNLDWQLNQEVSAFFTIDIDNSDDFKNWESVAKGVSLAQLKTNDAIVKHSQIKLKHFSKKFYRLTLYGERRPDIKKIELQLNQQQERPYNISEDTVGKHDESNNNVTYYIQSAKIVKKQLKVQIPENNVMANCRVYSRDSEDDHWTHRGSDTVYKITNNGETLKNEIIQLAATSDRQWKLEVISRGSGFEQKAPVVNFLWQPHVLTFVARGDGPFVLAYGSADYASTSVSQNTFFNTASNDEDQMIAVAKTSNKMDVFGGEEVLKEDLIKVTPKNMILWGVLVIGSLLLLFMAFSMLKSTPKNTPENTPED